jgi:dephospho-CoA kinase
VVLRIGVTGGIGSGKSTAAAIFAELGAVVVDADAIAREVVEPGRPTLAAVRERFGANLIGSEGQLDRPALGRLVFADPDALRDLEAIIHPAIRTRTEELMAAAPADAIVVHDLPLLVEQRMTGEYHLVVLIDAPEDVRRGRLIGRRDLAPGDARARMAAQADTAARRAAADVWLDNTGPPAALADALRRFWFDRALPFESNLRAGTRSRLTGPLLSAPDPTWPVQAERLIARVRHAVGSAAVTVDHVGSTAVPGLLAKNVIDLQVGVGRLAEADQPSFVSAMAAMGFPRATGVWADHSRDGTPWPKRFHGSGDPARVAHVHVRQVGSPGWSWALQFRDWLRDDLAERDGYAAAKAALAAATTSVDAYAEAKEPWFGLAWARSQDWSRRTGWCPPSARSASGGTG